jgi:hypothetical protein
MRQHDLFQSETPSEGCEDAPARAYVADPDDVRADLHLILSEARAAETLPWDSKRAALYRTIFPQMTRWLPEDEAAQLRFAFAQEMQRLAQAA